MSENTKKEKYELYFENYCKEDKEDALTIGRIAAKRLHDHLSLTFVKEDEKTGEVSYCPEMLCATFACIITSMVKSLQELSKNKYKEFQIDVCGRFYMGFDNNCGQNDSEKDGNVMVSFIPAPNFVSSSSTSTYSDAETSAEKCIQWENENNINAKESFKPIIIEAKKALKDEIDINLNSSSQILPILCFFYETAIAYMKSRRRERNLFEDEINLVGCFKITVTESEDDCDNIVLRCDIADKLSLKNDRVGEND